MGLGGIQWLSAFTLRMTSCSAQVPQKVTENRRSHVFSVKHQECEGIVNPKERGRSLARSTSLRGAWRGTPEFPSVELRRCPWAAAGQQDLVLCRQRGTL